MGPERIPKLDKLHPGRANIACCRSHNVPHILTIISFKHKAYNGGIPWPITFERIEIFAGCIQIWKDNGLMHNSMCDTFGKSQICFLNISKKIVLYIQ